MKTEKKLIHYTMNTEIINLIEQFLKENISMISISLNLKEKMVLDLRQKNKTLQEIGNKIGVSRERVRQIEAKANEKLRTKKEIAEKLYQYIEKYFFEDKKICLGDLFGIRLYCDKTNKKHLKDIKTWLTQPK